MQSDHMFTVMIELGGIDNNLKLYHFSTYTHYR